MNSHNLTAGVYILFVLVGVGMELASRRRHSRIPSLRRVVGGAMRSRPGRVGVVAGWAWLGLHLLAR